MSTTRPPTIKNNSEGRPIAVVGDVYRFLASVPIRTARAYRHTFLSCYCAEQCVLAVSCHPLRRLTGIRIADVHYSLAV